MIRSMTGFASVGREAGAHRVGVTIKSVNHRFLDVQIKSPGVLQAFDGQWRARVQEVLQRGRVEMSVVFETTVEKQFDVALNEGLLVKIESALSGARARGLVAGGLSVSDVLRLPQVLEIASVSAAGASGALDPDALALVDEAVQQAIAALAEMRATEGEFLHRDLDRRLGALEEMTEQIAGFAREAQADLEGRLRTRLAELPAELASDPTAVTQEVVRFIARSDIDEEATRLRGHFAHWRRLVDGPEPCGRKLDFLVQEMNREINTIGSKAEGTLVPELVVTAKAELERIKEQVQNVE